MVNFVDVLMAAVQGSLIHGPLDYLIAHMEVSDLDRHLDLQERFGVKVVADAVHTVDRPLD